MHLEPPTLWDYEYHKNLAPAAREITETLNEELKAVDGFLRIVPLGSSINVWRMRQACGRQSPYIGDLDCGVIIFTPQHKEHKVTKEISALTREYISSKGLHADRTVNPAQFYFNLHPNSTHEV
ncbi:MAG: hypothetical protein JNK26_05080, partial [Candidatus Doudnabacteria bacterium]|nr:hypothetical protein [Candidatus Doudnabacteria bacterium]